MNRKILSLAIPNIITNITVPLLGIVDMAIVGHLSADHIAAITIGTSIFNLIYWNFGFLRMGTSGFTAQAYGAQDFDEAVSTLVRAAFLALVIAGALLALQWPISKLALVIFNGSDTVLQLALTYFFVRIWAAPATLSLYAIKGWFIGMQNSRAPMWIAIFLNVVNILCSLVFVMAFHWGIAGVALGTVIAQYSGLFVACIIAHYRYGTLIREHLHIRECLQWQRMQRFFHVNTDIFLRTVCLAAVFTFITSASGKISDQVLAIDALLLQFFTLFSYFMDGFAYAGEALVGKYIGARDRVHLQQSVRYLLRWGLAITVLFTLLYQIGGGLFLQIFTSDTSLITATKDYFVWVLLVPLCGFAAFLFDGIFVGATAGKAMRNAMFIATAAFFAVYYGLKSLCMPHLSMEENTTTTHVWNHILWLAFLVYLALRGVLQACWLRKSVFEQVSETAP